MTEETQESITKNNEAACSKLSADVVLREKIRQRDKAIRDYGNDMATARAEGRAEGIAAGRAEGMAAGIEKGVGDSIKSFRENLRKMGMTEEQIAKACEGIG